MHEHPDLTSIELTTISISLLVAGHETTANFSGMAIVHLLRQPEQLAKFTACPENAAQFVEEILRYQCIGQNLARVELEIMLTRLFARFPELRLAVLVEELPFRTEMIVPGFHALPVTW